MDRLTSWRYLCDDRATASAGLATDEMLAARVGNGNSAPLLRLYSYRECALAGRFQNIDNEIQLDFCGAEGIPVNRRPTGGGAILMGPEQLGVALVLPAAPDEGFAAARKLMARFAAGLVDGLKRLGVAAAFHGKNDLEVEGRKLAGLGIFRHPAGGLLYHASLLVGMDVPRMLAVLKTPFEKIDDKAIAAVAARTTTVAREAARAVSLEEARQAVAEGFAAVNAVALQPGGLSAEESGQAGELERQKYLTRDWVHQHVEVADAFGSARLKTPAGLLDIRVTLAGSVIKAALIGGDFFALESSVASLEGALRWHAGDPAAVAATVEKAFAENGGGFAALPAHSLVEAINSAVAQARRLVRPGGAQAAGRQEDGDQTAYGCFVNPKG